jgi:hypothetical protein
MVLVVLVVLVVMLVMLAAAATEGGRGTNERATGWGGGGDKILIGMLNGMNKLVFQTVVKNL